MYLQRDITYMQVSTVKQQINLNSGDSCQRTTCCFNMGQRVKDTYNANVATNSWSSF